MRRSSLCIAALVLACAATLPPTSGAAAGTTLTFAPVADTNVSSQRPTRSYGAEPTVEVDASPTKQGFLRFSPTGLSGMRIVSARLRMYQVDASGTGGRVYTMSSTSWTEAMTWNTKPQIDGSHVATFGRVEAGRWYEVDVTTAVTGDGPLSFAIDSTSSNGADWASRETTTRPALIVEVASGSEPPGPSGLTEVAGPYEGSSDPTYFNANRRLAVTAGGRLLAVYGLHRRGVQLEWKDPGGPWTTRTTGTTVDGVMHDNGSTGDRPASIAVARDRSGAQHAWVVWSGENTWSNTRVSMRRLSDLDSPNGPTIGPEVTIDSPSLGAYKADVAFERQPDGSLRGAVLWSRKTADTVHELVVAWFGDLSTATPSFSDHRVLLSSSSSGRFGTLVPTVGGMRVVARTSSGYLKTFGHDVGTAPSTWWTGPAATFTTDGSATAGAAALSSGAVLAAVEADAVTGTVVVQRFSPTGSPESPELQLTGYSDPTIATDGSRAWVVMVRRSDGFVVSRELVPGSGWTSVDRVEIGSEGGGSHEHPNLLRDVTSDLVFLVRGPKPADTYSSVLSFERRV